MEVRAGTDTGHSGVGDDGSGFHIITGTVTGKAGQVLVKCGNSAAVIHTDEVAARAAVGGVHDTACGCRYDAVSDTDTDVDGTVVARGTGNRGSTIAEI